MSISHKWREYVAALSATLITAAAGTTVGWTSPTLPKLRDVNSLIPTSADQSSWIVSLMILSSALSPIPAAYLADRIGTKRTLLLSAIPYIIGWILVMLASNVPIIYASRLISGLGYGIAYTTAPMYLGEIASNDVRGAMATLITVMSKLGILSQYCIGPYVSMLGLASFNIAIPILFVVTFSAMPESPYYYIKSGDANRAERSLKHLRGADYISEELDSMSHLVNENMKEKSRWKDLFILGGNRRGLTILTGIYFTQQFCGSTAIISYAEQIFGAAEGGLGAKESCILLGSVQLMTSAISSQLVDRLGRKPLFVVTFSAMPESPYYYIKSGDANRAERSLKHLRGADYISEELDSMSHLVNENMKEKSRWKDLFILGGNRRGLTILTGIYFTQQFCGSTAIISYAEQIFGAAEGGLGAKESCILLGSVQLMTSAISSQLVDRLGRKPLLLVSSCGVGIANIIIGAYFYMKFQNSEYVVSLRFIPIVVIPIFIFSYTIGLATVPFAITSEIFPTNIKSKATCIIQILAALMTFTVTKLYQVVADNLGNYVAFWCFGLCSVGGVIFILVLLPETKGQSFAAIQEKLYANEKVVYEKREDHAANIRIL